jgi:polyhydroxyalkanoate synthesis regulator phasin
MKNKLKDVLDFGMGSALLAKEVIEDFADEMIRAGRARSEERETLIDELSNRASGFREDLETRIFDKVHEVTKSLDLVTREEFEELKSQVEKLKAPRPRVRKKTSKPPTS